MVAFVFSSPGQKGLLDYGHIVSMGHEAMVSWIYQSKTPLPPPYMITPSAKFMSQAWQANCLAILMYTVESGYDDLEELMLYTVLFRRRRRSWMVLP